MSRLHAPLKRGQVALWTVLLVAAALPSASALGGLGGTLEEAFTETTTVVTDPTPQTQAIIDEPLQPITTLVPLPSETQAPLPTQTPLPLPTEPVPVSSPEPSPTSPPASSPSSSPSPSPTSSPSSTTGATGTTGTGTTGSTTGAKATTAAGSNAGQASATQADDDARSATSGGANLTDATNLSAKGIWIDTDGDGVIDTWDANATYGEAGAAGAQGNSTTADNATDEMRRARAQVETPGVEWITILGGCIAFLAFANRVRRV